MNCKHVEKHLEDYLTGQLDKMLSQLIKEHLTECPKCQKLLEKEKSVSTFLKQVDDQLDKISIGDDLLSKLEDIDKSQDVKKLHVQEKSLHVRIMVIAAVVAGLIGIALLVIPFESNLNQQFVGSSGGPGFIWIGDFPAEETDPFSLDNFKITEEESHENIEQNNRVIHTLDFDDGSKSLFPDKEDPEEENL